MTAFTPSRASITRRVTGEEEMMSASASRVRAITSSASPMKGSEIIWAGTRSSAGWQSAELRSPRPWMTYALNGRSATGLSPSEVGCRRSELAVTAGSRREAPRARLALAGVVRGLAQGELVGHRRGQGQPRALPRGAAVAADAVGREGRDGPPQRLGFFAGPADRDHAVRQAEGERLLRIHRAAGQDQVERAREADELRQPDRAAVEQRHAPAAAEDPEDRGGPGHAQVAHQGELEPARHRVALDGRD